MELTNNEFKILHVLNKEAGIHAYEIAKRSNIKPTSIYNMLSQMEDKALLNGEVNEDKKVYYHSEEGHVRYLNQRRLLEDILS